MANDRNMMLLRKRPGQDGYGFMALFKLVGLTDAERAAANNTAQRERMGWQTTNPQDTYVLAYTDMRSNQELMNRDGFRGQLDLVH